MEPGCQAYFSFVPKMEQGFLVRGRGNVSPPSFHSITQAMTTRMQSKIRTSIPPSFNPLLRNSYLLHDNANLKVKDKRKMSTLAPKRSISGDVLGGWLTRPDESKSSPDNIILFAKYTTLPGKRARLNKVLYDGLAESDKHEPATPSILLLEDDS